MFPQFTKKGKNLSHPTTGCVLCKIFEHSVATSLAKHFTELDIFYKNAAWLLRKEILLDTTYNVN